MAKGDPKTRPKDKAETPFRKFERLARKIVNVPKGQIQERDKPKRS